MLSLSPPHLSTPPLCLLSLPVALSLFRHIAEKHCASSTSIIDIVIALYRSCRYSFHTTTLCEFFFHVNDWFGIHFTHPHRPWHRLHFPQLPTVATYSLSSVIRRILFFIFVVRGKKMGQQWTQNRKRKKLKMVIGISANVCWSVRNSIITRMIRNEGVASNAMQWMFSRRGFPFWRLKLIRCEADGHHTVGGQPTNRQTDRPGLAHWSVEHHFFDLIPNSWFTFLERLFYDRWDGGEGEEWKTGNEIAYNWHWYANFVRRKIFLIKWDGVPCVQSIISNISLIHALLFCLVRINATMPQNQYIISLKIRNGRRRLSNGNWIIFGVGAASYAFSITVNSIIILWICTRVNVNECWIKMRARECVCVCVWVSGVRQRLHTCSPGVRCQARVCCACIFLILFKINLVQSLLAAHTHARGARVPSNCFLSN